MRVLRRIYNLHFSKNKTLAQYIRSITGCGPVRLNYYVQAFRHKSNFKDNRKNNERLEILGDAILGSIVLEYLYHRYPYKSEGFLSELRSKVVNRKSLNVVGQKLNLLSRLSYNKRSANNVKKDLYGNTFEALVGAIYLDCGYHMTTKFIHKRILGVLLDLDILEQTEFDFKSKLIIHGQRNNQEVRFELIDEKDNGGRHLFVMGIFVDDKLMGQAEGYNKKSAEQEASRKVLEIVKS